MIRSLHILLLVVGITTDQVSGEQNPPSSHELLTVAQRRELSVEESGRLALSYFSEGKFAESLTVASLTVGRAKEPQQKALLLTLKAQNEAALGQYLEATKSAKAAQRLSPDSPAIALLRVAYAKGSGVQSEMAAAVDHLKRVDPNIPEPVMDAKALLKAGLEIAYSAWIVWQIVETEWPKIKPHIEAVGRELTILWGELNAGRKARAIP